MYDVSANLLPMEIIPNKLISTEDLGDPLTTVDYGFTA